MRLDMHLGTDADMSTENAVPLQYANVADCNLVDHHVTLVHAVPEPHTTPIFSSPNLSIN